MDHEEPGQMQIETGRSTPIFGRSNSPILIGGLVFVYLSALAFIVAMYLLWLSERHYFNEPRGVSAFYPVIILCGIGVFSAVLGVGLLRAAGAASIPPPGPIVSPLEWGTLGPEVQKANEDAITQYVRLRSLTGFTGMFTKLGLQGLPLATIALTIFFALMFLRDAQYMDLAKLTLGAFIGSFVQKQVGERQAGGGTVQLPTGEKLTVKSSSPPTA